MPRKLIVEASYAPDGSRRFTTDFQAPDTTAREHGQLHAGHTTAVLGNLDGRSDVQVSRLPVHGPGDEGPSHEHEHEDDLVPYEQEYEQDLAAAPELDLP